MSTVADIVIMLDQQLTAYPDHWPIVYRADSLASARRATQFDGIVDTRPRAAWHAQRLQPIELTDTRTGQLCPAAIYQLRPAGAQS